MSGPSKSRKIGTQILLPASPEEVWSHISDLDGWSRWTRVLKPKREQVLRVGQPFLLWAKASVWYLPFKYFPIRGTVQELTPGKRLIWDGRFLGVYGRHGIEIESAGDGVTRLQHWEEAHGWPRHFAEISGFAASIRKSFNEYNLNLKNYLNAKKLDWTPKYATLSDGKMAYYEAGNGPTVVLVHGYPQSAYAWRHQFLDLSQKYHVIAPDLYGWGKSDKNPELIYDFDSEILRLKEFLECLRLGPVHLIAHDYGGLISLGYALRNQQQLKTFVIINSRSHATFRPHWLAVFYLSLNVFFRIPGIRHLSSWLPIYSVHKIGLRKELRCGAFNSLALEQHLGHFKKEPTAAAWLIQFFTKGYKFAPKRHLLAEARTLRVPTTVVWGSRDRYLSKKVGQELAEAIPRAKLVELAGRDHYVMEECPDEVTSALLKHFESL
jgi:cis-3-alkyl-4-acyloxetan-2-one decarboxylase